MQHIACGDTSEFSILVDRYSDKLLRYLNSMTNDWHLAEDLLQEVWIHVHQKSQTYDVSMPFQPWVYRIAFNQFMGMLRTKKSRRNGQSECLASDLLHREPDLTLSELHKDEKTPLHHLFEEERYMLLQRAIFELSEKFRDTIINTDLAEETSASYAKQINITTEAVRLRREEGKSRMRSILSSQYPEYFEGHSVVGSLQ